MTLTESETHDLLMLGLGICIPLAISGIAAWVIWLRMYATGAIVISGEALERAKKRGES